MDVNCSVVKFKYNVSGKPSIHINKALTYNHYKTGDGGAIVISGGRSCRNKEMRKEDEKIH